MFRRLTNPTTSLSFALVVAHAALPSLAAAGDGFEESDEVYETIHLTDGTTIRGLILVQADGQDVVVRLPGGKRTTIPRSSIRSIGNGAPAKAEAASAGQSTRKASDDEARGSNSARDEAATYRTARKFAGYAGLAVVAFLPTDTNVEALNAGAGLTINVGMRPRVGPSYPGESGGMWHGAVLDLGVSAGGGFTRHDGDAVPIVALHGGFAPAYQFLHFERAKDGVQKALGFSLGPRAAAGILLNFEGSRSPYFTPHLGGQMGLSFLTWNALRARLTGSEVQFYVVHADGYVLGQLGYEGAF